MRCRALGEFGDQMSFMCIVLGQIKNQSMDGIGMKIKEKIKPSSTRSLSQKNKKLKKKKSVCKEIVYHVGETEYGNSI